MLLMFAVGYHRLDWMLALGLTMAAERLTPWGRRLAWLVGLSRLRSGELRRVLIMSRGPDDETVSVVLRRPG